MKALVSNPSVSQRCQLVKTLSKPHLIGLKPSSKSPILQINDMHHVHDLEQLVWDEQQLVDAEGRGFFRNK